MFDRRCAHNDNGVCRRPLKLSWTVAEEPRCDCLSKWIFMIFKQLCHSKDCHVIFSFIVGREGLFCSRVSGSATLDSQSVFAYSWAVAAWISNKPSQHKALSMFNFLGMFSSFRLPLLPPNQNVLVVICEQLVFHYWSLVESHGNVRRVYVSPKISRQIQFGIKISVFPTLVCSQGARPFEKWCHNWSCYHRIAAASKDAWAFLKLFFIATPPILARMFLSWAPLDHFQIGHQEIESRLQSANRKL